jgi:hypothetical protein
VPVRTAWWNTALAARDLPGRLTTGPPGADPALLTRAELFRMGRALESNQDVLRLLWHVLAWGSGSKLRLNRRRLDGISKAPAAAAAALRHAARLSRTDPQAA